MRNVSPLRTELTREKKRKKKEVVTSLEREGGAKGEGEGPKHKGAGLETKYTRHREIAFSQ